MIELITCKKVINVYKDIMLNKSKKGVSMNNNSWQFSFHKDKNISFCTASILTGYFEYGDHPNEQNINALQSVHNLNKKQVKTAINEAKKYIAEILNRNRVKND